MSLKDKITILIGGKPAKDLPVEIGQDGVIAMRASQTEIPGDEFRRKLSELDTLEAQHRAEKEKATHLKELASKTAGREEAQRNGKDPQQVIAGYEDAERKHDRAIQIIKDKISKLFLPECERFKAGRHAKWPKIHADMVNSLKFQISDAIFSGTKLQDLAKLTCLNEESEAYKEMARFDIEVDSCNKLAKEHRMPGNLFIPDTLKMLGPYKAAVGECFAALKRRSDAVFGKFTSDFDAKASEESERAKKLERAREMSSWLPDKYSNLPQI
jgi:hypothetical protein